MELNLQQLGLDYIDLTLMHFPIGYIHNYSEYDYIPTWKEMEKIVAPGNKAVKGKSRYIGISNFNVTQLEDLLASTTVKPKVRTARGQLWRHDLTRSHRSTKLSSTHTFSKTASLRSTRSTALHLPHTPLWQTRTQHTAATLLKLRVA